jgi:hypothetical protein
MNTDTILRLLKNSGFNVLGTDGVFINIEDPSCLLRSFEVFIDYAWIVITAITGVLLFGWAISMIRGAKTTDAMYNNIRNLTLIFGILAAVKPIVDLVYGEQLFARGCKTINVSIAEVQKILDARNAKLATMNADDLYEEFDIYDSGADGGIVHTASSAREVVYTNPDGTRYKKVGGTTSWRNNNPGNLRYTEFSKRAGAIGEANRFAVFPDEATGIAAIDALMRTETYRRLTIADGISRYAPPSENDTAAYHKRIGELTGLPIGTPISQLSDAQIRKVVDAIIVIEGQKAGDIIRM